MLTANSRLHLMKYIQFQHCIVLSLKNEISQNENELLCPVKLLCQMEWARVLILVEIVKKIFQTLAFISLSQPTGGYIPVIKFHFFIF